MREGEYDNSVERLQGRRPRFWPNWWSCRRISAASRDLGSAASIICWQHDHLSRRSVMQEQIATPVIKKKCPIRLQDHTIQSSNFLLNPNYDKLLHKRISRNASLLEILWLIKDNIHPQLHHQNQINSYITNLTDSTPHRIHHCHQNQSHIREQLSLLNCLRLIQTSRQL